MENNDKIFDQFKNATQNVAPKEFPSMEKVWSRIEDKLDTTVLKKETSVWKKIAVAALILLCVSIGYQFFKTKNEIEIPDNQVVVNEKPTTIIDNESKNATTEIAPEKPRIAENGGIIMQNSIASDAIIAYNEPTPSADASPSPIIMAAPAVNDEIAYQKEIVADDKIIANKKAKSGNHFFRTKIYDAIGVHRNYEEVSKQEAVAIVQKDAAKKQNPLYVIDGEAVADNKTKDSKSKLDAKVIENIVILKEPLYIINGVQYSEEELFGDIPTSPYAPLDKQEITKTIILQGDEAEELYGEKGKKGVVIITTKNGKPAGK